MFHVVLENNEDGWILTKCPALPDCMSHGKDQAALSKNKERFRTKRIGRIAGKIALLKIPSVNVEQCMHLRQTGAHVKNLEI